MVNETLGKRTHGYKYTVHHTRWQKVQLDNQPGFLLFKLPGNYHYILPSTNQAKATKTRGDRTVITRQENIKFWQNIKRSGNYCTSTCCIAGSVITKEFHSRRAMTRVAIWIDVFWCQQADVTAASKIGFWTAWICSWGSKHKSS